MQKFDVWDSVPANGTHYSRKLVNPGSTSCAVEDAPLTLF